MARGVGPWCSTVAGPSGMNSAAAAAGSVPPNVSGSATKGSAAAVMTALVARFTEHPFLRDSPRRASGDRATGLAHRPRDSTDYAVRRRPSVVNSLVDPAKQVARATRQHHRRLADPVLSRSL